MRYETGKNATINGITYRGGDDFPNEEFAKLHPRHVKKFVEQRIIVPRAEDGAGIDHTAARNARSNSGKLLASVQAAEDHGKAVREAEAKAKAKADKAKADKAAKDAKAKADADAKKPGAPPADPDKK